jgi:hypothetical protein
MTLPFTLDQFLSVFEQYNLAVWPMQIVLNVCALAAVFLAVRKTPSSDRIIAGILGFLWVWIGIAYHLTFFVDINPAAKIFGVASVIQGIVFLHYGFLKQRMSFRFQRDIHGMAGALLIVYALVFYPSLGYILGHVYPKSPTFGLPCPTTIFTFGLLLWTGTRPPLLVFVIPFLWSLIGFSAALTLGMLEDTALLVVGIVCMILTLRRPVNNSPMPKA